MRVNGAVDAKRGASKRIEENRRFGLLEEPPASFFKLSATSHILARGFIIIRLYLVFAFGLSGSTHFVLGCQRRRD
jgi:hypothetical protein